MARTVAAAAGEAGGAGAGGDGVAEDPELAARREQLHRLLLLAVSDVGAGLQNTG